MCVRGDPFSIPFCVPFQFFSRTIRLWRAFARKGKPWVFPYVNFTSSLNLTASYFIDRRSKDKKSQQLETTNNSVRNRLRVRSFGVIWIRISNPRSLGSWYIKGTDESVTRVDSSVPLMHHDPDRSWITDPDPDHSKGTHPKSQILI